MSEAENIILNAFNYLKTIEVQLQNTKKFEEETLLLENSYNIIKNIREIVSVGVNKWIEFNFNLTETIKNKCWEWQQIFKKYNFNIDMYEFLIIDEKCKKINSKLNGFT